MMTEKDFDELRDVTVGLLDKLNQLAAAYYPMQHKPGASEALASFAAYRVTLRGYLAKLAELEKEPTP
jgi:hypothetical protein